MAGNRGCRAAVGAKSADDLVTGHVDIRSRSFMIAPDTYSKRSRMAGVTLPAYRVDDFGVKPEGTALITAK